MFLGYIRLLLLVLLVLLDLKQFRLAQQFPSLILNPTAVLDNRNHSSEPLLAYRGQNQSNFRSYRFRNQGNVALVASSVAVVGTEVAAVVHIELAVVQRIVELVEAVVEELSLTYQPTSCYS